MKFKFRNFGPIKEAELELRPLTLIAGKNQVGKTFINKAIYSILEPIPRYQINFKYGAGNKFGAIPAKEIESKFRWVFQQDRLGNLVNKFVELKEALIEVESEGGKGSFQLRISSNSIRKIAFNKDFFSPDIVMEKAIYIATPIVLDIVSGIATYREFFKNNYGVPDIYWDIIRDIRNIGEADIISFPEIYDKIKKLIGGEFKYDKEVGFIFLKRNKKLNISLAATGTKLLGLFQLLIKRDFLKQNSILILEEPDAHLHPELRFKLAELLVEFSNNGVSVIISTHSPELVAYFRYALQRDIIDINNCSFLHLKSLDGLVSAGISENSSQVLDEIMMSLTEDYFDLSIKEVFGS